MPMLIALFTRRDGLTREEFRRYYEDTHAPFNLDHLRTLFAGYSRSYVSGECPAPAGRPVDVVTHLEFADDAALREMFSLLAADPEARAAINDAEERFIDRAATHVLTSTERTGHTAAGG